MMSGKPKHWFFYCLFLALVGMSLSTTSCAPRSTPIHPHPRYGWVSEHGTDPYDQGVHIVMPADAPSVQGRFRPLPTTDEQGNFLGIHEGIDISGEIGDPILAPAPGAVVESQFSWLWGNTVRLDHGRDEHGRYIQTMYLHLTERWVEVNQRVERGQQIGTMGITGASAGNPTHLHYVVYAGTAAEFSSRHKPVNPHLYWADGVGVITCYDDTRRIPEQPLRFTYPVPCLAK
jgi:murein DD-endopeptidase MepM/ murein hydrolase activator NlpD